MKYRLSEILVPSDPNVIQENLAFNRETMKNKLLSLGNEASKEIKRKLKESLKSRNDNQIKTIKEGSMRMLLKDLIFYKSDFSTLFRLHLGKKTNDRILKDIHNELSLNKMNYRSVKEIKRLTEQSIKKKETKDQKRKEQNDDEE